MRTLGTVQLGLRLPDEPYNHPSNVSCISQYTVSPPVERDRESILNTGSRRISSYKIDGIPSFNRVQSTMRRRTSVSCKLGVGLN